MEARAVESVDAAVAGVTYHGLTRRYVRVKECNGSAHAEVLVGCERRFENVTVRVPDRVLEELLHVVSVGVAERFLDRIDGELTGDLATGVAADAVTDDEKSPLHERERAVLVYRPLRAEASVADQCGIELSGALEPGPTRADPALLSVMVRNLIDNALRYSPPGATVHIQAHASGDGGIQVTVEDSGPGLSPQDISRLGERFFRVLGTRASGSGLGWSIVRRIADLQGLTIEVSRSAALGGATKPGGVKA